MPYFIDNLAVSRRRGMHVSQTDGQTDRRTDDGQSDPYVSLCFAGDTKSGED